MYHLSISWRTNGGKTKRMKEKDKRNQEVVISQKTYVEESVIKNLLSAHRRIANEGTATEVIKISKYILKLTQKGQDKLFQLRLEKDE